MNGPSAEVPLVEAIEDLEDQYRVIIGNRPMTPQEMAYQRQLRSTVSLMSEYAQERSVIRAIDRRGVDSEWVRRVLVNRWKHEPDAAA